MSNEIRSTNDEAPVFCRVRARTHHVWRYRERTGAYKHAPYAHCLQASSGTPARARSGRYVLLESPPPGRVKQTPRPACPAATLECGDSSPLSSLSRGAAQRCAPERLKSQIRDPEISNMRFPPPRPRAVVNSRTLSRCPLCSLWSPFLSTIHHREHREHRGRKGQTGSV
jgi:hypothetical protein